MCLFTILVASRHVACLAEALHCMQVVYEVQMENGVVVMAVLYLVYAEPSGSCCQTETLPHQIYQADMHDEYAWHLVERSGWSCFASIFYNLLLFSISYHCLRDHV